MALAVKILLSHTQGNLTRAEDIINIGDEIKG